MARGRAQLSEKEERIMVQAQLMGLNTASMIRIGNRLRAIDEERRRLDEVGNEVSGFSWEKNPDTTCMKTHWRITSRDGKIYTFVNTGKKERNWNSWTTVWDVSISKPGTRFKDRTLEKISLYYYKDIPKKMLPEGDRDLYAMICNINKGNYDRV